MTPYERLFGAGPRGILIGLALLVLAWKLELVAGFPAITGKDAIRWTALGISIAGAVSLAIWSLRTLPPGKRGATLVTNGPFRYVRHPLYATLVTCFHYGLALFLDNWIYILWALLVHALWHWNIRSEEQLMAKAFPGEYDAYCKHTGRFFPRLFR